MNSRFESLSPTAFTRREALRAGGLALGAAAWSTLLSRTGLAADANTPTLPADAPPEIKIESLGEKFAVISGAGGNIAVLGGDDGALVIDSGLASASAESAAAITKTVGPLALLVNTHWHFDHVGGNERLSRAGARIIGSENCRKRMSAQQYIEFFDKTMPPSPAAALPLVTIASETTIHVNGDDLRLTPVPPAHTDGDLFIRFEKANVVHCGDLFFRGMFPFIDYSTGGWIGGMAEGAKRILAVTDAKTRIIPGHGPIGTRADLEEYLKFLETVLERLNKLKAEGKTVDEAVVAAPTKGFDESRAQGLFKPDQFVRFAYAGLLKHT